MVGHLSCHIHSFFPLIKAYTPCCLCNSCHLAQDNGVLNNPRLFPPFCFSPPSLTQSLFTLSHYVSLALSRHWQTSCHLFLSKGKREGMIYKDGVGLRGGNRKRQVKWQYQSRVTTSGSSQLEGKKGDRWRVSTKKKKKKQFKTHLPSS